MALNNDDKKWITNILQDTLDEQEQKFESKIVDIKSDFYTKIDPILKEVIASQEERLILSDKSSNHEERLEKVEAKLSIQPAT